LKSGSLNLLEPSGPVQACNGIALPLPLQFTLIALQGPPDITKAINQLAMNSRKKQLDDEGIQYN